MILLLAGLLGALGPARAEPEPGDLAGLAELADPADPADPAPSTQTLLHWNARMALREGHPLEALELWMLRNAVQQQTGAVSADDADFRTVTWAALGALGVCQDGLRLDDDGAGLWAVALHNWAVRNLTRAVPAKRPRAFDGFQVGRQQRYVSVHGVLGAEELETFAVHRGRCVRPRLMLIGEGLPYRPRKIDRATLTEFLTLLLTQARLGMDAERVRGRSVVEARLFDLRLQLAAFAAQEARREAAAKAGKGRASGMSRASTDALVAGAPSHTVEPGSQVAAILDGASRWPAADWLALSPDRRLFLYDHARAWATSQGTPEDLARLDDVAERVVDALIAAGRGGELSPWIARVADGDASPERRAAVWGADRGQALLGVGAEEGFDERAPIALHRGVSLLEAGDLDGALRTFAFALQVAPESAAADDVQGLCRRWLSYAVAQFAVTDGLLVTLQELVPRQDYAVLLEDLMWRAAFHADATSFQRGLSAQVGRTALERRLALLRPLATGDVARFTVQIRDGVTRSPSETMRFLDQLLQRLELEDADVRVAQIPTLLAIERVLSPLADDPGSGSRGRSAAALVERAQAVASGVAELADDARSRARALDPSGEVYAGAVRLAPVDPLPWPFAAADVAPPSPFAPIVPTPQEWRDAEGALVYGWSLGG